MPRLGARLAAAIVGLAVAGATGAARADDAAADEARSERLAFTALGVGFATLAFPVGIGAVRTATGTTSGQKNAGFMIAGAGLALAPVSAHVVVGEIGRGVALGIPPAIGEMGIVSLFAANEDAAFHGSETTRTTFGALFTLAIVGAAVGLVDASLAGDRLPAVSVTPRAGGAAISIGGAL